MNQQVNKSFFSLINVTLMLLVVYNILYWSARLKIFMPEFYTAVAKHWKLIMFLEFLAVASVTVDLVVRFDLFNEKYRKPRFIVSALIALLFMARFILGVIELYMRGEIRP
jgi:hypothetical protein